MAVEDSLVAEINSAIEIATEKPTEEKVTNETVGTEELAGSEGISKETEVTKEVSSDVGATEVSTPVKIETEIPVVAVEGDKEVSVSRVGPREETVARAVKLGISPRDARMFRSENLLLNVLDSLESKKPTEVDDKVTEDNDLLASLPKLDPDVYEADVIKMYDGLVAVIKKQNDAIKSMQSSQAQVVRANQESVANDTVKWFDEQVAKLGADFTEVLGSGGYNTLEQGSPQYQKRDQIANQTSILLAGYRASGQRAPSRDEIFSQAARLVLGDEYQKVREQKLSADLERRSTQHIARVGKNNASKSKGDPVADIAAMLDERYFAKT